MCIGDVEEVCWLKVMDANAELVVSGSCAGGAVSMMMPSTLPVSRTKL